MIKSSLKLVCIILPFYLFVSCQNKVQNSNEIRGELENMLSKRSKALIDKDVDYFISMLDETFIYTNASGNILDKNQYIDTYISSDYFEWKLQDLEIIEIKIHEDIVIISCKIHDMFTYKTNEFDTYFLSTQVFKKIKDNWCYLAGHTSNFPIN